MTRELSGASSLRSELIVVAIIAVAAIAYIEYRAAIPVPAPETVIVRCLRPAELEQLHIVATLRDDNTIEASCMYVGSRGTYTRGPRR